MRVPSILQSKLKHLFQLLILNEALLKLDIPTFIWNTLHKILFSRLFKTQFIRIIVDWSYLIREIKLNKSTSYSKKEVKK